jgi:hypothetical protein
METEMIVVIAVRELNETTQRYEDIVSHGVDADTLDVVVLPQELLCEIGAEFNRELGEYVLY